MNWRKTNGSSHSFGFYFDLRWSFVFLYRNYKNSIKKDEPATWHLALINADKLVDTAMRELQISGQTMGERLKNSKDKFSSPNSIWHAHKLRNVVAHENDAQINFDQTRRAMNSFKQALKDLGAI